MIGLAVSCDMQSRKAGAGCLEASDKSLCTVSTVARALQKEEVKLERFKLF